MSNCSPESELHLFVIDDDCVHTLMNVEIIHECTVCVSILGVYCEIIYKMDWMWEMWTGVRRLSRTSVCTVAMATSMGTYFTGLSRASWYRQEIRLVSFQAMISVTYLPVLMWIETPTLATYQQQQSLQWSLPWLDVDVRCRVMLPMKLTNVYIQELAQVESLYGEVNLKTSSIPTCVMIGRTRWAWLTPGLIPMAHSSLSLLRPL